MTINDTEYAGNVVIIDNVVVASFPEKFSTETLKKLMETESITDNGVVYNLLGFRQMKVNELGTEIRWDADDEVTRLTAQVTSLSEQITEKNSQLSSKTEKLEAVRAALIRLLVGVPTISEYLTFVRSVKEAIGYVD